MEARDTYMIKRLIICDLTKYIFWITPLSRMSWSGNIARMGEIRNAFKFPIGNPDWEGSFETHMIFQCSGTFFSPTARPTLTMAPEGTP
jgi:hypothetical protein